MGRHQSKNKEASKNPLDMMREQMDELMGKNRNSAVPGDGNSAFQDFADPSVDKYYLCGCSPYDLLKGTKSETLPQLEREGFLKERSEGMRMRWEALPQEEKDKYGYERDLYDLLVALVEEQDSRVAKLRARYDAENAQLKHEVAPELKREIENVQGEVVELLTQAEMLGEAGQVDEAFGVFTRGSQLNSRLVELERRAAPRDVKKQWVDEVSGLVYSSTDNEARIADLQAGRQYQAWKAIRERLLAFKANPPPGRTGREVRPNERRDHRSDDRFDDRRGGYGDRGRDDRGRDDRYDERRRDDRYDRGGGRDRYDERDSYRGGYGGGRRY